MTPMYAIKNRETGEFFVGKRGHAVFKTQSAATNAYNQAHSGRYDLGKGLFQSQDEWVHVRIKLVQIDEGASD